MHEHTSADGDAAEVVRAARAAEDAVQHLCRTTRFLPAMTPAEIDGVLAHLSAAAAALPQAAKQLGEVLEQAKEHYVLEMDILTETEDPDLAINTARNHLDTVRGPALELCRLLDDAHNQTAHIAASDRDTDRRAGNRRDPASLIRRPEDRQPPTMGADRSGPGLSR